MSSRPPIAIPNLPINSAPTTPTLGKGHAHNPLEDHLYLQIGTGEDAPPVEDPSCYIVSESPSNADINVYETAYQEEIARIQKVKEEREGDREGVREGRPTLYLTRRVENMRSLKDSELVYDAGRTRDELKASIKLLGKRAAKGVEERAELQRMKDPEGREGFLSKGLRNVRGFKDLVDEAREIVREEERRDGKRNDTRSDTWKPRSTSRGTSRSSTPTPGAARGSIGSRSATPIIDEKEKV
jgi:[calcium/calmodulin-dependent protein kinase] kinase